MPRNWQVEIMYETPDGEQRLWAGDVPASSLDAAISKAQDACARENVVETFVFEMAMEAREPVTK